MAVSVISYMVFVALFITDLAQQQLPAVPKYVALGVCIVATFTAAATNRGDVPELRGLSVVEFLCLIGAWTLGLIPDLPLFISPLIPATLTVVFYLLGRQSIKNLEARIDALTNQKVSLQLLLERYPTTGRRQPLKSPILILVGYAAGSILSSPSLSAPNDSASSLGPKK
jgi:hypothetical protein